MKINKDILRQELGQLELSFYEMKHAEVNLSSLEFVAKREKFLIEKNNLLAKYGQENMVNLRQLLN